MSSAASSNDVILSVDGLSKKFCRNVKQSLFYGIQDIGKEITGRSRNSSKLRPLEFWAVRNVTFNLERGSAIGLVGQNGSGKTTLLRMISGLFKPDTGSVRINGRVAPLLALGAGFNPVLSGRENIFINMSILGQSREEIVRKFDSVVDFAEIGDAIDAPVQTYSSGMTARLGFACAIHTEPELLLIDEVLSVGDMRFRSKCYRRLAELRKKDTSFVMVSHNPNVIMTTCASTVYLEKGVVKMIDTPAEVMKKYEEDLIAGPGKDYMKPKYSAAGLVLPEQRKTDSGVQITSIQFVGASKEPNSIPQAGRPAHLILNCNARFPLQQVTLGLLIREIDSKEDIVLNLSSDRDGKVFDLGAGGNELRLNFPYLGLRPGVYTAKVFVTQAWFEVLDAVESFRFRVDTGEHMTQCLFYQPRSWESHSAPAQ